MEFNYKDNKEFTLVYTSANGTNFYSHLNPIEISPIRGIQASKAERFISLNITPETLIELVNFGIEGANKEKDLTKSVWALHEIKKRLHYLCEENTLLELANIYYFIDGEDPKTVSEAFRKKKFEIWDNDIECKSFFLLLSLELTGTLKNTPKEDLLKFMESPIYQSEMEKLKRYL